MATGKPPTANAPAFVNASSGKDKVTLLEKCTGDSPENERLLEYIFQPSESSYVPSMGDKRKKPDFSHLPDYLNESLDAITKHNKEYIDSTITTADCGRLGPDNVVFDFKGNMGTLLIEADRLGLSSHSNFSSIRANTCVYKGKWLYELMLGSRGVMQLGWCTANCVFTQEEGVGDTDDSYAYDGNRLRKWNRKIPLKYGEVWLTGDVITCAIDCDIGTVTFYRNGKSMGEAFTDICLGPGFAYFPAVSLSIGENLRANFGVTPLRYPVADYRPLQDPPALDLVKAQHLFEYLDRAVPLMVETDKASVHKMEMTLSSEDCTLNRSKTATLLLAVAHVFDKLAPLLKSAYIVEACLLKFLLQGCEVKEVCGDHLLIQKSLDLIWSLMQENERKSCLDNLMTSLVFAYRFSPATPQFSYQLTFLVLTYAILKHDLTRKYLIKNVLFDKIKFPTFLHIKPPDDEGLVEIVPEVCLDLGDRQGEHEDDNEHAEPPSEETLRLRAQYFASCDELNHHIAELEYIQVQILKLLLINNDNNEGCASTRFVFLHKFREFLHTNLPPTRPHITIVNQCPLSVCLSFFHRLLRAVRSYWDDFYEANPAQAVQSQEAFVPCSKFYDDSINYFEMQRLGGLLSHLKKTHKEELDKALIDPQPGQSVHMSQILNSAELVENQKRIHTDQPLGVEQASCHSLVELLDGIIMLYNIAAHKQLAKMCTLRDTLHEYVDALSDTNKKIEKCPQELHEVRAELERARDVFQEKGTEQVRQMAWVIAVIYAQDKQEDVYWLLQVLLRTINKASESGKLFTFMPDFYMEACVHTYQAIKSYFHPMRPYTNLPGFSEVLSLYAVFLCEHFSDSRIISDDSKDVLIQALATFVCGRISLKALENIAVESRLKMTKALLAPYENRSWARTNWILVRLWKGCGFGFRYKHLPHLNASKVPQSDHIISHAKKPCPSLVIQQHIAEVLRADEELATKFLDTVLKQLNWAFSEFIGMLQELQSIASRPTAALIDSRHLKICATCFDISVGLLRVLEMLTSLVPEFFTDWSKPLSEQLLCRLCQLLTQVLNRITSKCNTFDMIVAANIPGLETVHHFPVLSAVAGILIQLLLRGSEQSRTCATQAILAEPGFQISCLEFLTGGSTAETATGSILPTGTEKSFSFSNYEENISEEELATVNELLSYVKEQQSREQKQSVEVDEDSLCEICYARPKSVRFIPCGHQSCKSCISHQMMNKKECFFCKAVISSVKDD